MFVTSCCNTCLITVVTCAVYVLFMVVYCLCWSRSVVSDLLSLANSRSPFYLLSVPGKDGALTTNYSSIFLLLSLSLVVHSDTFQYSQTQIHNQYWVAVHLFTAVPPTVLWMNSVPQRYGFHVCWYCAQTSKWCESSQSKVNLSHYLISN